MVGEDDLLQIVVPKVPASLGGQIQFKGSSLDFNLYHNRDRTQPIGFNENLPLPVAEDLIVWVEGLKKGNRRPLQLYHVPAEGDPNRTAIARLTMFEWTGPLNVPQYGEYWYEASGQPAPGNQPGELPEDAGWTGATGGTVPVDSGKKRAGFRWGAGPTAAKAIFTINQDYIWDLTNINVVGVSVTVPQEANGVFEANEAFVAKNGSGWDQPVPRWFRVFSYDRRRLTPTLPNGDPNPLYDPSHEDGRALWWRAKVTLTGPNGGRGVDQMQAGFIQNLKPETFRARFDNGNDPDVTRTSSLQGTTYFDGITGASRPWYEYVSNAIFNGNGEDPEGNPDGGVIAVANGKAKVIGSADTPFMAVPYTYQQNVEANYIERLEMLWRFSTWVSVRTLDERNDAHAHYANQALASWSWDASGDVNITDFNVGGNHAMTYTRDKADWVGAPTGWQAVSGGQAVLQDPIFNSLVEDSVDHWYGN